MKKYDIFISYQHTLKEENDCVPVAMALCKYLENNGYVVYLDLFNSEKWTEPLKESRMALVILSDQFKLDNGEKPSDSANSEDDKSDIKTVQTENSESDQSGEENKKTKNPGTFVDELWDILKRKEQDSRFVVVPVNFNEKFDPRELKAGTSSTLPEVKPDNEDEKMALISEQLYMHCSTKSTLPHIWIYKHLRFNRNFSDTSKDLKEILEEVNKKIGKGRKTKKKNNLRRLFIGLLIGILIALGVALICNYFFRHTETIVFAGGSTVANYLKENYGIDVNNSGDNSTKYIYIHMPSEAASLILEEDKEIKPGDYGYYYPVVLSAEKLSEDSAFIEMAKKFMENEKISKKIVECELGKADLVVYVNDPVFCKEHQDSISLETLQSHLKQCQEHSIEIFTTSEGSGTLKCYRNKLLKVDTTFILPANDLKISNLKEDCRFVILGNRYYPDSVFIKSLEGLGLTSYKIKDGAEQSVPLYIYTIAHKSNEENFDFELGKPLRSFFERLGTPIIGENWYKCHVNSCPFFLLKIPTK